MTVPSPLRTTAPWTALPTELKLSGLCSGSVSLAVSSTGVNVRGVSSTIVLVSLTAVGASFVGAAKVTKAVGATVSPLEVGGSSKVSVVANTCGTAPASGLVDRRVQPSSASISAASAVEPGPEVASTDRRPRIALVMTAKSFESLSAPEVFGTDG